MRSLLVMTILTTALALAAESRAQSCDAGTAAIIDQHGVSFTFDKSYSCGQFANGDYWVAPDAPGGTVQLTAMTPAFDGSEHGFEINPDSIDAQGFDSRAYGFDAARVPALPLAASAGQSIVKAVSVATAEVDCRPCVDTAAVLTVLDTPPSGLGSTAFRPPYFGADKPLIDVSQLRPDALPSLAASGSPVGLAWVEQRYGRVQLDHQNNWVGRFLHPVQNMPDYGSDIGRDSGDAVLQLMLDDSVDAKMPALIAFVQFGIDLYYMMRGGQSWAANGGHHNGRKLAIAFAGVLLGDDAMKTAVMDADEDMFGEDGSLWMGTRANRVLWGQPCNEDSYWQNQIDQSGSRTCRDPYGYIDGGEEPGGSYQFCCNSGMWKGTALALHAMPELRCVWNNEMFVDYIDRWIIHGAWSAPDPCAPSDGNPNNLGVTYGPDGNGGCIADNEPACSAAELADGATAPCIGRWPARHGSSRDDGHYGSAFAAAMWSSYREGAVVPECVDRGEGGSGEGGSGAAGAPPAGAAAADDGGCGCEWVGRESSNDGWWLTLALALTLSARRRRRRR